MTNFTYVWYLFDNEASFNSAKNKKRGPHTLDNNKIIGGVASKNLNIPNVGDTKDLDPVNVAAYQKALLADGKWLGLAVNEDTEDNFTWIWAGKKITLADELRVDRVHPPSCKKSLQKPLELEVIGNKINLATGYEIKKHTDRNIAIKAGPIRDKTNSSLKIDLDIPQTIRDHGDNAIGKYDVALVAPLGKYTKKEDAFEIKGDEDGENSFSVMIDPGDVDLVNADLSASEMTIMKVGELLNRVVLNLDKALNKFYDIRKNFIDTDAFYILSLSSNQYYEVESATLNGHEITCELQRGEWHSDFKLIKGKNKLVIKLKKPSEDEGKNIKIKFELEDGVFLPSFFNLELKNSRDTLFHGEDDSIFTLNKKRYLELEIQPDKLDLLKFRLYNSEEDSESRSYYFSHYINNKPSKSSKINDSHFEIDMSKLNYDQSGLLIKISGTKGKLLWIGIKNFGHELPKSLKLSSTYNGSSKSETVNDLLSEPYCFTNKGSYFIVKEGTSIKFDLDGPDASKYRFSRYEFIGWPSSAGSDSKSVKLTIPDVKDYEITLWLMIKPIGSTQKLRLYGEIMHKELAEPDSTMGFSYSGPSKKHHLSEKHIFSETPDKFMILRNSRDDLKPGDFIDIKFNHPNDKVIIDKVYLIANKGSVGNLSGVQPIDVKGNMVTVELKESDIEDSNKDYKVNYIQIFLKKGKDGLDDDIHSGDDDIHSGDDDIHSGDDDSQSGDDLSKQKTKVFAQIGFDQGVTEADLNGNMQFYSPDTTQIPLKEIPVSKGLSSQQTKLVMEFPSATPFLGYSLDSKARATLQIKAIGQHPEKFTIPLFESNSNDLYEISSSYNGKFKIKPNPNLYLTFLITKIKKKDSSETVDINVKSIKKLKDRFEATSSKLKRKEKDYNAKIKRRNYTGSKYTGTEKLTKEEYFTVLKKKLSELDARVKKEYFEQNEGRYTLAANLKMGLQEDLDSLKHLLEGVNKLTLFITSESKELGVLLDTHNKVIGQLLNGKRGSKININKWNALLSNLVANAEFQSTLSVPERNLLNYFTKSSDNQENIIRLCENLRNLFYQLSQFEDQLNNIIGPHYNELDKLFKNYRGLEKIQHSSKAQEMQQIVTGVEDIINTKQNSKFNLLTFLDRFERTFSLLKGSYQGINGGRNYFQAAVYNLDLTISLLNKIEQILK